MSNRKHGMINANGIDIHYVEQGEGPMVIFCHGFPELWYAWRHQLTGLAEKGYRAVALDMRGYGQTSQPEAVDSYSVSDLVGDVVGAVSALGEKQAVVVGHDWGATIAWYGALMRPDVFRAVAALSVPFNPPMILPKGVSLTDLMLINAGGRDYYRLSFQPLDTPEAELEADVRRTVVGFLYSISGDIIRDGLRKTPWEGCFPVGETLSQQLIVPEQLPDWLTEEDVAVYVDELTQTGFRGGLNWYRNINRLPEILAPFAGRTIEQPSLYLYGEYDLVGGNTEKAIAALPTTLPDLRANIKFEGAGHWLQEEQPEQVNRALLEFLAGLES